jgi:predicted nucleic acid-binding protein
VLKWSCRGVDARSLVTEIADTDLRRPCRRYLISMTDEDTQVVSGGPSGRGIFDGFDGYVSRTDAELKDVLSGGMVVVDTNVLLNLYRYNHEARSSLLRALSRFGTRLWVPNQVMVEFWRNRINAIEDSEKQLEHSISALKGDLEKTTSDLRTWVNRVSLDRENSSRLERILSEAHEKVISTMKAVVASSGIETEHNTSEDKVLTSLASLLQGKVGDPLDDPSYTKAVTEGRRRLEAQIPPGYMDKKKEGRGDASEIGDYLVWLQVVREAQKRAKDVLLVTADAKEDWWRIRNRIGIGPRNELAEELLHEAKVHLYMLKPERLLIYARDLLAVAVSEDSVQNVGQVDSEEQTILDKISVEEAYFAAYRQYVREQGHFPNARQFARFLPALYGGGWPDERHLVNIIRDLRYRFQSEADAEFIP